MEKPLLLLYPLLEEEISHYQSLIAEIEKESQYLQQGFTEGLIRSVRSLEQQTTAIHRVNGAIRKTITAILATLGKEDRGENLLDLMEVLPFPEGRKIRSYQRTLEKLKEWVSLLNNQNKNFIQEALAYGRNLFALLTQPGEESSIYLPSGQRGTATFPPQSLNRRV